MTKESKYLFCSGVRISTIDSLTLRFRVNNITNQFSGIFYVVHLQMPRRLEDFIQMTGRCGRKDGVIAICLLFIDIKPRDLEESCNDYRLQDKECRRSNLAERFQGNLVMFA